MYLIQILRRHVVICGFRVMHGSQHIATSSAHGLGSLKFLTRGPSNHFQNHWLKCLDLQHRNSMEIFMHKHTTFKVSAQRMYTFLASDAKKPLEHLLII